MKHGTPKNRPPREVITQDTCLSCGACCVAPAHQKGFADVTAEDCKRLDKRFVRLHVFQPSLFDRLASSLDGNPVPYAIVDTKWARQASGPFKGSEQNTCSALRGSVLSKVRCSVYEKRPQVCRTAVKPGDRTCRYLRAAFKKLADAT